MKQIGEQALHFLWAFIALLPVCVYETWWSAAISAFIFALPREIVDQWPINKWWDTAIDLLFFALGGAAVGAIFLN